MKDGTKLDFNMVPIGGQGFYATVGLKEENGKPLGDALIFSPVITKKDHAVDILSKVLAYDYRKASREQIAQFIVAARNRWSRIPLTTMTLRGERECLLWLIGTLPDVRRQGVATATLTALKEMFTVIETRWLTDEGKALMLKNGFKIEKMKSGGEKLVWRKGKENDNRKSEGRPCDKTLQVGENGKDCSDKEAGKQGEGTDDTQGNNGK